MFASWPWSWRNCLDLLIWSRFQPSWKLCCWRYNAAHPQSGPCRQLSPPQHPLVADACLAALPRLGRLDCGTAPTLPRSAENPSFSKIYVNVVIQRCQRRQPGLHHLKLRDELRASRLLQAEFAGRVSPTRLSPRGCADEVALIRRRNIMQDPT